MLSRDPKVRMGVRQSKRRQNHPSRDRTGSASRASDEFNNIINKALGKPTKKLKDNKSSAPRSAPKPTRRPTKKSETKGKAAPVKRYVYKGSEKAKDKKKGKSAPVKRYVYKG